MAQYKYSTYLHHETSVAFDDIYQPGDACKHTGIYRCETCGDEIAVNKGAPLPSPNHHQHASGRAIRWRLIVVAQQR